MNEPLITKYYDPFNHVTEHFCWREFQCKDKSPIPDFCWNNIITLAEQLEIIRSVYNAPIYILSGYRSKSYNDELRKKSSRVSPVSQHLQGKAADICIPRFQILPEGLHSPEFPKNLFLEVNNLIKQGRIKEGGLGCYPTFVHYDIRGQRARWNYD